MFLQDIRMFSVAFVATELDLYLSGLPDIFSRISDIYNIFFLNRTSGHFERRRGSWTGHFQLDLWRRNWAFFKRLLLRLLWQKLIFLSRRRNIFWSNLWRQNQVFWASCQGVSLCTNLTRWWRDVTHSLGLVPAHRPWSSSQWRPGPWRGRTAASRWKDGPAAANSSHSRTRPHQEVPTQLRGEKVITVPH